MTKTRLHYTEVLTASTGKLVAYNGMDGAYAVHDAIAGPGVTTLALTYLAQPCRKYVREKHPEYDSPAVDAGVDKAIEEWRKETGGDGKKPITPYMDKHVLPLLPSEWTEVEHFGQEEMDALMEGYTPHLEKTIKGKGVLVVNVG